jgi:hypothetical protein
LIRTEDEYSNILAKGVEGKDENMPGVLGLSKGVKQETDQNIRPNSA